MECIRIGITTMPIQSVLVTKNRKKKYHSYKIIPLRYGIIYDVNCVIILLQNFKCSFYEGMMTRAHHDTILTVFISIQQYHFKKIKNYNPRVQEMF
jgi:hypothetical protein